MDVADLLLAYLAWHFSDFDGDFHVGDDVFVEDATASGDELVVMLLMPDGSRKQVVLSARLGEED